MLRDSASTFGNGVSRAAGATGAGEAACAGAGFELGAGSGAADFVLGTAAGGANSIAASGATAGDLAFAKRAFGAAFPETALPVRWGARIDVFFAVAGGGARRVFFGRSELSMASRFLYGRSVASHSCFRHISLLTMSEASQSFGDEGVKVATR
jgi:hypothetical protein